jgi:UDP-N-acetylmuramoylalanine--D-glutamate ligase
VRRLYSEPKNLNNTGMNSAILGYGLEGKAMEVYLKDLGQNPTILDEKKDPNAFANLEPYDIVYRSPGIPVGKIKHPNVSSVTKVFFENCPCPIIGITGTKGKGTTSTLIFEMLKAAGKDVYIGGNIGRPAVEFLPKLTPESLVVLELSSFQLEDLNASPNVAVVLNVTSEHLDIHPTTEAYRAAKHAILAFQKPEDIAFINGDYEGSSAFATLGAGQKHIFHVGEPPIPQEEIGLRGVHNLENITPALLVAQHFNISFDHVESVLKNFKGLPHRLEPVGSINGVDYFNDSIATTPDPSIAALHSFEQPIFLIAGGSDKGANFTEWGRACQLAPNLKKVLLIGLTAPKLAEALPEGLYENCDTLEVAVSYAKTHAKPGDCILLSPACASFDQFENYKARGEAFKKLLPGTHSARA